MVFTNIRLKNLNLIVGNKDQIFEQVIQSELNLCQKSLIPAVAHRVEIGRGTALFK